jgi:hypothetical protein
MMIRNRQTNQIVWLTPSLGIIFALTWFAYFTNGMKFICVGPVRHSMGGQNMALRFNSVGGVTNLTAIKKLDKCTSISNAKEGK